jgi:hypothetical protein
MQVGLCNLPPGGWGTRVEFNARRGSKVESVAGGFVVRIGEQDARGAPVSWRSDCFDSAASVGASGDHLLNDPRRAAATGWLTGVGFV